MDKYGKYCQGCFRILTESGRRELLVEEAAAYYQAISKTAEPTGDEAALQNLVLPIHDGPELASYAAEPFYLSPEHCRICFADCSSEALATNGNDSSTPDAVLAESDPTALGLDDQVVECSGAAVAEIDSLEMGVDRDDAECLSPLLSRGSASNPQSSEMEGAPDVDEHDSSLAASSNKQAASQGHRPRRQVRIVTGVSPAKHVLKQHGLHPQKYRRHVRCRDVAVGPQRVTAQIVRTRLTAWKKALNDEAFAEDVCSCCAQSRSRKDLEKVVFPCRNAATPPAWLRWSDEQWQVRREAWYDQIHEVFDVEQALQKQFQDDERVREAEAALLMQDGCYSRMHLLC